MSSRSNFIEGDGISGAFVQAAKRIIANIIDNFFIMLAFRKTDHHPIQDSDLLHLR